MDQFGDYYTNADETHIFWCNDCRKRIPGELCKHWDDSGECPFEETEKARRHRVAFQTKWARRLAPQINLFEQVKA
jgi:hypothetical protein